MKYPVIFRNKISESGFTLVELMLVVSLTVLLSAMVFPIGMSFYQTQVINDVRDGLSANLQEAQMLAITGKNDSAQGIYFQDDAYVLFVGDSYEERLSDNDEIILLASKVNVSGPAEIVFAKFTGLPNVNGTVTISLENKIRQIEIMPAGTID